MALAPLPRPPAAVVFDMDGLLVDSERGFNASMLAVSAGLGLDLPMAVVLAMVGGPREQNREVALAHFGPAFGFEAWMDEVHAHARAAMAGGCPLKPGAAELVGRLARLGIPMALATSSEHGDVARQLGPCGILPRLGAVVARGDYARGKPHPDPFLLAAERLGVDPTACLALEDSLNGVRAAAAAGMMTVMVPDLIAPTDEIRALAFGVAGSLAEVGALFADFADA